MARYFAGLLSVAVGISAFGQPASRPSQPVETSFQEGQVVNFSGFPVDIEFQEDQRLGVLRFGVATRDLTLPCYEDGSNTWVLRDLSSRLEQIVSWNSKRLFRGERLVDITVRGRFSVEHVHLWLDEVFLPRIAEGTSLEEMRWERFDPDRDDRSPAYAEGYPVIEYDNFFPPPEEILVDEAPLGSQYAVSPFQPPLEYPTRYYPQVEYEPPYSYRVYIPPGRGIRVGGSYFYSAPQYDYSWDDYYNGYYPLLAHPRRGDSETDGEEPGEEVDGREQGVEVPLMGTKSAISPRLRTESRAERWGRARRINAGMNDPTLEK